ncbi:ATP synthase subunit I [Marinobacter sp. F4206]|uniref:ATP synthase subunit I n=1 Tax=Marinobacter sp. F4206 TaxID=2861777 RepID=UPI001C5F1A39|nr:ATP synthase subunit I [Marinobacter sp. F4206]MBW4935318.1 ATP synthase subunit I [Marinobacter sp. F4206]
MITADWTAVYTGFWIGAVASTLFFAGLAVSVRWALRAGRPGMILLPSAAVRIALLLGVGWWVTGAGSDSWAFVGYVAAFFLVRLIATVIARLPRAREDGCN